MTDDTRLDDPHEVAPPAPHLGRQRREYAAGPMNTGDEEPMAEPEVRTAPDAGAIHWHAQLEPGIPADESDPNFAEATRTSAKPSVARTNHIPPRMPHRAVTALARSGTVEG